MRGFKISTLAIPSVCLLIAFLSYTSQYLFYGLEPNPLDGSEFIQFNVLVLCIWISYSRTCLTNPGNVPRGWTPESYGDEDNSETKEENLTNSRKRWCRKCEGYKPPRSHHCKVCQRCIPKMDHHCPWTNNCVSHLTFPHFTRFLFYSAAAMSYLEYFLYIRGAVLWDKRKLPSYLGPSTGQLVLFFILLALNSLTLFLVSVTFVRTVWGLGGNVSTIESWEIERHHQLLRRARALGGYLDGPDGMKIKLTRQEFPYDIGIWQNIKQGMGTGNLLAWFWPFSRTPRSSGLSFEVNGFEDSNTSWPPPDPDRIPRLQRQVDAQNPFTYQHGNLSATEEIDAFKTRQQEDVKRREAHSGSLKRQIFHNRFGPPSATQVQEPAEDNASESDSESGEEGWQDSNGNRLNDYGVDEEVEFYDEDNIPLSLLLHRREERREWEHSRSGGGDALKVS